MTTRDLHDRWLRLWQHLGATADAAPDAAPLLDELLLRYAEPQRAYHTLHHIRACLADLDRLATASAAAPTTAPAPPEAALLELAIWYHDAVYDPRARDNEEQSAALALRAAHAMRLPDAQARRLADLILCTKTHDARGSDPLAALLLDIDLAILGAAPDDFARYDHDVRREYAWVPGFVYRWKRRRVLRQFLSRVPLYRTPLFQSLYEEPARRNLRGALGINP